ncbi:C1 family peptidase [Paenibacillus whitsoniae]|uniref:Cysteine peptidase n=1 Tax=Paenibacillus whitsoniae TaxID=2496558 RepID=A0A430J7E3_9BACL|nr:C1 family peptidase [Paenibacillus whitsoniae]RTE05478.1 cysteine peptidase [Paenibacillus whitsoniae]
MTRQYLLKPDKPDTRDFLFAAKATSLPDAVDLRPKDAALIFDQGSLGSCTANALCALMSYMDKNFTYPSGLYFYYSRLFLYWQERNLEGTVGYDSGAYLRDGLKVMQQIGCAGESTYPYVESTFTHTPTAEAYATAAHHKINEYHRIMTAAQLKEALSEGRPVVMGIEIYSSFESADVARTGIVSMPDKRREALLGGHAVLAMGYKVIGGIEYIICRNSWGADWGDKGYFYLPMDFIGRYVSDMWVAS